MINWSPGLSLKEVEKQVIEQALRFFDNNKTKTAQALGIAIRTLDARLEEYGKKEEPDPNQTKFEIPPITIETVIPDPKRTIQSGTQPGKATQIREDMKDAAAQPERRRR